MLDALDIFRIHFSGRPLLLLMVLVGLSLIGSRNGSSPAAMDVWMRRAMTVTVCAGLLGLLCYPLIAIWYASDWHFFDNAEPTIPAIGWLFHLGQPLYHAPDSAQRYALIYGPMAFIVHGVALAWLGPEIVVSKSLGVAAGILSLVCLFVAIRRHQSILASAALTGVCALLLLAFRHYSFWTRPDPLQVLSVSAALLVAVSGRGLVAAALVGLISGLLWNLKFTGPLYTLPVLCLVQQRTGLRGTTTALVVAAVAATLPFVSFPNVSLAHYLTWIDLSARTGLTLVTLRQNLEWAGYMSVPLLLSYAARSVERRAGDRRWLVFISALLLGMCGVAVAAAKPGAGPYHLLPFLPLVLYAVAWKTAEVSPLETLDPAVPRASIAFLVVAAAIALAQQAQFLATMSGRRQLHEADDIRTFAATHSGVIAMGYGRTEVPSLARPILVFMNGSYLLDQPAVREHQLAGLEIPRSTVEAIAHCDVSYWLVPKGDPPFSGVNSYPSVYPKPLYTDEFRRAFAAAYNRVATTEYYDVWQCRAAAAR